MEFYEKLILIAGVSAGVLWLAGKVYGVFFRQAQEAHFKSVGYSPESAEKYAKYCYLVVTKRLSLEELSPIDRGIVRAALGRLV